LEIQMVEIFIRWQTIILPAAFVVLALTVLVLLIILFRRRPGQLIAELGKSFASSMTVSTCGAPAARESARGRQESAGDRQARDELRAGIAQLTESLLNRMAEIARLRGTSLTASRDSWLT
jgi:hypothetical protein